MLVYTSPVFVITGGISAELTTDNVKTISISSSSVPVDGTEATARVSSACDVAPLCPSKRNTAQPPRCSSPRSIAVTVANKKKLTQRENAMDKNLHFARCSDSRALAVERSYNESAL